MVEKDTREAYGPAGEPAPFTDTPRSEGNPAAREPESRTDGHGAQRPEAPETPPAEAGAADAGAFSAAPAPDAPAPPGADARPASGLPGFEPVADPVHTAPPAPEQGPGPVEESFRAADAETADARGTESTLAETAPVPVAPPDVADAGPTTAPHEIEPPPDTVDNTGPPEPEAGPVPEIAHETAHAPATPASDDEPWRGAIAEALAEPPAETRPTAETAPQPTPSAPPPTEPSAPAAPAGPAAAAPGPGASDTDDDSAFTAAAADLFHPPDTKEEPHLITLGRRLDPALRIPRPDVPDIAPRPEPPLAARPPWWRTTPRTAHLRTALRYAAYAIVGYFALVLVLIVLFRFVNPPGSMLMLTQALTGTKIERTWVPLGEISPHLVRAVIVSEDGRFCEHSGVDTAAIKEAIERAARGTPRGASTISMQVTKNLFLWNAKSYLRKVIEIPLTLIMELVWPKRRVLEVYLNIAEWGPGVFGAEAAARRHFHKSAARLNERESALLAAVLPNPVVRDASAPGPQTSAKARVVQARVRAYGAVASCAVSAAAPTPPPAATMPAVKPRPARKPAAQRTAPARKKPQQQPQPKADDWTPTLNFGPR